MESPFPAPAYAPFLGRRPATPLNLGIPKLEPLSEGGVWICNEAYSRLCGLTKTGGPRSPLEVLNRRNEAPNLGPSAPPTALRIPP